MQAITSVKIIAILLTAAGLLYPGRAAAVFTMPYLPTDSTTKSLALKKDGEIKERIYVGDEVRIKTKSERVFTGPVMEIQASRLLVGSSKVFYRDIDWVKVKKKKPRALTILKWIGIAAGIAVLAGITFIIMFSIAFSGGGAGAVLLGLLINGGLYTLFGFLASRKKYRLKKYELEVQEAEDY